MSASSSFHGDVAEELAKMELRRSAFRGGSGASTGTDSAGRIGGVLGNVEASADDTTPVGTSYARMPAVETVISDQGKDTYSEVEDDNFEFVSARQDPRSYGVPDSVSLKSTKPAAVERLKAVWKVPNDFDEFQKICRTIIGKGGPTICVGLNCHVVHHGGPSGLRPGDLVIEKSRGQRVYVQPRLDSSILDGALLADWSTQTRSLDEWTSLFDRARSASDYKIPVDHGALSAAAEEEVKAVSFKTPRGKKRASDALGEDDAGIADIGIASYSPTVAGPEDFEGLSAADTIEKLCTLVTALDDGVGQLGSQSLELKRNIKVLASDQIEASRIAENKITVLKREIGSKNLNVLSELDAADLWGCLTALLDRQDGLSPIGSPMFQPVTLRDDIRRIHDMHALLDRKIRTNDSNLKASVERVSSSIRAAGARMDRVEREGAPGGNTVNGLGLAGDANFLNEIAQLNEEMKEVRGDFKKLKTASADGTMKFGGLNFENMSQSNAWLEIHMAPELAALVVDPHSVLENLEAMNSGQAFLKSFGAVHKLAIGTLSRGIAMTSFERPVPKLFSTGIAKVVKMPDSHLDRLPNYHDYTFPETGQLAMMKDLLADFEVAHQTSIDSALGQGTVAHFIATLSLTESVNFVDQTFKFQEDYMKHLTTAKFDVKKAWHIVTRLTKRLFVEMFAPRQGVMVSFNAGDPVQISRSMFWSILRSLDIAMQIKKDKFANSPLVSNELVKFLSTNTGFEAIDKLEVRLDGMKEKMDEAIKLSKSVEKANGTLSNKVDEMKRTLDTLVKRVQSLENKK